MDYVEQLAHQLIRAQTSKTPIAPIVEAHPSLSIIDAYQISKKVQELRMVNEGVKLVGRKIGITSKAVQQWLNVDQPDFGYINHDKILPHPGELDHHSFIQPRIEGEIAFVLKKNLLGPGLCVTDIINATDFILPALEVVDSRIKNWNISIADTVADNASSGYCVLGHTARKLCEIDLYTAGMSLYQNGVLVSSGAGAACLGHPVNAVVWLANMLGELGEALKAGEVIMSGALGPVVEVKKNDRFTMTLSGLGTVSCCFN